MKAWVLALVLVAACSGCRVPAAEAPQPSEREFLGRLQARTVQVMAACEGGRASGSGVILGASDGIALIATAAHVADAGCVLSVYGVSALVVARDSDRDLAVLAMFTPADIPMLGLADWYLGMPVIHVGYPHQLYLDKTGLQVSRGYLVADYGDRQRVSSSFYFGSSGGPVFGEQGDLVGIVVSLYAMNGYPIDDQYLISPAAGLQEMLYAVGG